MRRVLFVVMLMALAGCASPAASVKPTSTRLNATPQSGAQIGESAIDVTGGCVASTEPRCVDYVPGWGRVEIKGRGSLHVAWNATAPAMAQMHVLLYPDASEANTPPSWTRTGESPIEGEITGLPVGTYQVRVYPAGTFAGHGAQEVSWRFG